MPHMEHPRDIRRRDDDGKRFFRIRCPPHGRNHDPANTDTILPPLPGAHTPWVMNLFPFILSRPSDKIDRLPALLTKRRPKNQGAVFCTRLLSSSPLTVKKIPRLPESESPESPDTLERRRLPQAPLFPFTTGPERSRSAGTPSRHPPDRAIRSPGRRQTRSSAFSHSAGYPA